MAALLAAFGWTVSAVCWTVAGKRIGSMVVNTVRLIVAFPLFMIYGYFAFGEVLPFSADPKAWYLLGLSGFIGFFLCDLFIFRSFLLIGPRLAMLIFSLSPIVAAICGFAWLDERLAMLDICGIVTALTGVAWVVMESPHKQEPEHHGKALWWGVLLAAMAAITQGVANVIAKGGMRYIDSPIEATAIRLMAGLACFLVLMPLVGKQKACIRAFGQGKTMLIIVAGAIAGPTLGVALLMYSLTKIPTGLAMTFISLMPIMIMPFSVILFKEHISPRAIVGAVIACIGSALLLR